MFQKPKKIRFPTGAYFGKRVKNCENQKMNTTHKNDKHLLSYSPLFWQTISIVTSKERGVHSMEAKDLAWNLFCQKGHISDYLFYSSLSQEDEEEAHADNQNDRTGDSAYEHRGI